MHQFNKDHGFNNYGAQNRATVDHPAKLTQTISIMEPSWTDTIIAEHIEDCTVGAGDWLAQNFERSKDFTLANYQIHQTALNTPHQPTKVMRTTSIREPSLIEPTNVTNQPQRNHGRKDHGLKQIRHGEAIGNVGVGDSWDLSEYHS